MEADWMHVPAIWAYRKPFGLLILSFFAKVLGFRGEGIRV